MNNINVYEKSIKCPVCEKETKIQAPKKGSYRPVKKDSDLMQNYEGINPLFYEIDFCNECGYAALPDYFNKIKQNEIDLVKSSISLKWEKNIYQDEYSVEDAIRQHKLALLNAMVKKSLLGEQALICLKLSWLYRINNEKAKEKRFQEQAILGFETAYQSERLPIGGLDEWNLLYIMGELYRRIGDKDKSLALFSKVMVSSQASSKLKDLIRDVKDLMME